MLIDLEAPGVLKALAKSVLHDIDDAAIALYSEPPRSHLGASSIGENCHRKLWYSFRWAAFEANDGRQFRLFNRGHKEETRFIEWLAKAEYRVLPIDPNTGNQWRVSGANGHFGGSCDGIVFFPERYEIASPLLLEFKTNGTGKGFNDLLTKGCAVAKPVHYDQQNVYGYKLGLGYSLYLNVCKNDDNIYSEIIKLNPARGAELEKKACLIIESQEPPKRISESKSFFECKFCTFIGVCHEGLPLAKNCRSCISCKPIEDKQWQCVKFGVIPKDFLPLGCGEWSPIA